MSLPLGHAFAGITVACLGREVPATRRADVGGLTGAVVLAGLPDLDFVLYWLIPDSAVAVQLRHGVSHSLLLGAVVAGIFCLLWRAFGSRRRTFWVAWAILASHSLLDGLYTNTPVALFWPVVPEAFNLLPVFPGVEIHGDMSVLVSRVFVVHLIVEGFIGTITAVPAYLLTRRPISMRPPAMPLGDI